MLNIKKAGTWIMTLVLMITVAGASQAFALDPKKTINQYGHNTWTRQNGLPTNSVNTIVQTRDGYIWFGTSAGLFRFDGVNFNLVHTDPEDSNNLETVSALCEGNDGSLWIGTAFNFVCRLKDGKIRRYVESDGVGSKSIRTIFTSREGHVWLGSSFGLYRFTNEKFISIPINPSDITSIAEDSTGSIWVGTHGGIRIIKDIKISGITKNDGLPHDFITSIYIDRQANVWIGTADGLVRWNSGKMSTYTVNNDLSNNRINVVYEDRDHNIWVGTQKGLNRLSDGKWSIYNELDGLTHNNVLSFVEDYEGSLWVSTSNGLNQFSEVNITSLTTYEGLANDFISSVIETQDGSLYFLSDQGSSITQLKNGKIIKYSDIPIGPAHAAQDGSLWIGQTGLMFNIKDGHIKRYDASTGLPAKWISAIGEDEKSIIVNFDGIGIRRFVHGQLKPYVLKDGKEFSSTKYVARFYLDPEGVMWIGRSCGLVRIQNGVSTIVGEADGMAELWVNSFYDDRQGGLWMASPNFGLLRFKNGKFVVYNTKVGLFTNELYCVLGDDQDDLWLSSPRGIGRVNRKELDDFAESRTNSIHTKVYVIADGMKTDECFGGWQPAGWKTQDGRLWFATRKGAVMIDTKTFKRNMLAPPLLIEKVIVDRQTITSNSFTTFLPGSEKFEFHYTALSYLVPDRILFKYKLEGYDQVWVDAGMRRAAYYTNLPSGEYRFRVIACNKDGVWNETGANFAFELEPYFYQTLWFYGLVLFVIGGAGFGVYRIRIWQLLTREKELHASVDEALAKIKVLNGLIPICANCKKIRNDKGYWDQIESYIQSHTDATFSHGICPDCADKFYSEYFPKKGNDKT